MIHFPRSPGRYGDRVVDFDYERPAEEDWRTHSQAGGPSTTALSRRSTGYSQSSSDASTAGSSVSLESEHRILNLSRNDRQDLINVSILSFETVFSDSHYKTFVSSLEAIFTLAMRIVTFHFFGSLAMQLVWWVMTKLRPPKRIDSTPYPLFNLRVADFGSRGAELVRNPIIEEADDELKDGSPSTQGRQSLAQWNFAAAAPWSTEGGPPNEPMMKSPTFAKAQTLLTRFTRARTTPDQSMQFGYVTEISSGTFLKLVKDVSDTQEVYAIVKPEVTNASAAPTYMIYD
ncbi:hypothetical protein QBC44DRAFT_363763 [Cladorrhinum sp. PSN332]|nr:hypothetical protein QBC44DRAFT_363763 [Cladorrhinum sp. PSN332]